MISEDDEKYEQFRLVWRAGGKWRVGPGEFGNFESLDHFFEQCPTEVVMQRRRKRDHLDPTPCEGIEHPIWRDWEASPDPEIQAVLVRKGMPFRSLEK